MKHIYTYPLCILLAFAAGASFSLREDTEVLTTPVLQSTQQPIAAMQAETESAPLTESSVNLELASTLPAPMATLEALEEFLPTDNTIRLQLDRILDGALTKDADKKIEQAIDNLAFKLNLSPSQSEKIRAVANEYFIRSDRGEAVNIDRFNSPLRLNIESLLDQRQLADYSTLMDKSRRNWIEAQAYAEMARMQSTRLYSDEEKDILFQRIAEKYDR